VTLSATTNGAPDRLRSGALEVRKLTKRFGDVVAVDDVSFAVQRGTVTGFLGPNGAGKTTTLRMLLGLIKPTSGMATIGGRSYRDLAEPLHHVGAVLEAASYYPGRTARNHLNVQAAAGRIDRRRVGEVLDLVGLTGSAGRRVGGFSLGMRQRLGLATALLGDPEILILDEPANGLDPEGVRWLRQLLHSFAGEGRTVLVSSHVLAEVAQTVDRVVILDHGRIVADATLVELTASADTRRVVHVRTSAADELLAAVISCGGQARQTETNVVDITGLSPEQIGELAAARAIPVFESTTEGSSLEEIFFQLTADAAERARP
jgi:ABC-2 type transport system ATP-binding protein